MITAIHSFNGARTQRDLNFDHGDIMKLISIIENVDKFGFGKNEQDFIF